jgi:predicted amidohydrolase YtcJ
MRRARIFVVLALGLTLLCAHATAAEEPADLVVVNAKVLTVDPDFSQASAAAIRDGVFVAVGDDEAVRPLIGGDTQVIDAKGKTVIPGLIETHVHATGAARGEVRYPFVQLGSIAEIQDWLRQRTGETAPGEWIRLPRVDVTRIRERRMPTRAELDEAAPEHPAVFNWQYANRQIQVLNSAAIRTTGITKDTEAPSGGKIHLDQQGNPTGVLENCGRLMAKFLPRPDVSEAEYLDSLERLLRHYNALGITSIFERNSNVGGYQAYRTLKSQDRMPLRVTVTIGLRTDGTVAGTERAIRALPFQFGDGDDWIRVGPLKVRVDGGILYGTAFMREPYGEKAFSLYGISDPRYRGSLLISPEKLNNIIATGNRLGWQMCSHVTGDAGVDAVLDAVEAADADIRDRRYTLIHAYFAGDETAKRAVRLGVCVDTQPAWYYKDGDALSDALGPARLRRFIGVATWQRHGVKVALNSDHMQGFGPKSALNPYDPFLTMYVAVSRKTQRGQVIGSDQRVSREQALRMMTVDAAYLGFDENRKGSIELGKLGDLAILSDDLMACPEERIKDIHALVTVVGGKVVHSSQGR